MEVIDTQMGREKAGWETISLNQRVKKGRADGSWWMRVWHVDI
jgi:hypothetical protein